MIKWTNINNKHWFCKIDNVKFDIHKNGEKDYHIFQNNATKRLATSSSIREAKQIVIRKAAQIFGGV